MRIASTYGKADAFKKLNATKQASDATLTELSQEFEGQFIGQMLQNMFSTVPVDEEFGGGTGEEMYRSLMIDEYGKLLSRTGGIGIADHVKREMIRLQETGASHV